METLKFTIIKNREQYDSYCNLLEELIIQDEKNCEPLKNQKMKDENELIRVYSGTELTVMLLKDELEKFGIAAMIQNDFNSGISAGFSGGAPSSVDLFIQASDFEKAEPIVNEFIEVNN